MDKSCFKSSNGAYITQSLFFETANNRDLVVYTLDGTDKTVNGRVVPSLKKLFLEAEDPVEYNFANTYLFDWPHWVRLNKNKFLFRHFEAWRKELELRLLSKGVKELIEHAKNGDRISSQWLAERKFDIAVTGKRNKEEADNFYKEDSPDSAEILRLVKGNE